MARVPVEVIITAKDEASKAFQRIGQEVKNTSRSMASALQEARIPSAALGASLLAASGYAVRAAAEFEQNTIALETMLGSTDKADELMRDLVNFAKTTPFELRGLQKSTKQLLAYGSTQETVLVELEALGNIAAGVGQDKLPQLILAYGQVQAATKLTGAELRQFTEAGVPLLDALAKQFDVTRQEVVQMISDGVVGFEDVQAALFDLSGEGGKFFNLMQKQSKSTSGRLSNLKDAFDILAVSIGEKMLPTLNRLIDFMNNDAMPAVETLRNFLKEHRTVAIVLAGALAGALAPALLAVAGAAVTAGIALAPFIAAGGFLAALAAGLDYIMQRATGDGLLGQLKSLLELVLPPIRDFIQQIRDAISLTDQFMSRSSRFNVFQQFGSALDLLRMRQHGGTVATGQAHIVGESGPELFVPRQSGTIIPNDRMGGSGGGVNFTVNVGMYAGSVNERRNIAETLYNDLVTLARSRNSTVAAMLGA